MDLESPISRQAEEEEIAAQQAETGGSSVYTEFETPSEAERGAVSETESSGRGSSSSYETSRTTTSSHRESFSSAADHPDEDTVVDPSAETSLVHRLLAIPGWFVSVTRVSSSERGNSNELDPTPPCSSR